MSAFHTLMEYAREHLPGIAGDIEYDRSTSLRSRKSVMAAVAELMRRINYVPPLESLGEHRGYWHARLKSDSMKSPKTAAQHYGSFVRDMNDDMVGSLMHELQCRVAREQGLEEPPAPTRHGAGFDTGPAPIRQPKPEPKPRRSSDEEVDAVVGRLLEKTPLNDENWGAW